MRFIIDAQLPPRLVERFQAAGHDAVHVFSVLAADATDLEVASEANRLKAILLTKDEDFVDLSVRSVLQGPLFWLRSGNMTTDRLWQTIEPLLPAIESAINAGESVIEVA